MESFIIPNNLRVYGNGTEPFMADRNCELTLECWTLKNENIKKNNEIEKLKNEIGRLKFALKRSMETVQELSPQNEELNARIFTINSELITTHQELNEERSKTMLQGRVIESHKKTLFYI